MKVINGKRPVQGNEKPRDEPQVETPDWLSHDLEQERMFYKFKTLITRAVPEELEEGDES